MKLKEGFFEYKTKIFSLSVFKIFVFPFFQAFYILNWLFCKKIFFELEEIFVYENYYYKQIPL